jgi:hypothetical protein
MKLADLEDSSDNNIRVQAGEISTEMFAFFKYGGEGALSDENLQEML